MRTPMQRSGLLGWFDRYSDMQARQLATKRAREQQREYAEGLTSGIHDAGGLASLEDCARAGMFNASGLFVGMDDDAQEFLFYNRDGSATVIGRPSTGKGATFIQPNLGHLGNEYSIVVIDIGAENYRVTADYRRDVLGQEIFACNPAGLYGIGPSVTIDPIAHIREAGRKGDFRLTVRYVNETKHTIVPEKKDDKGDAKWIGEGSRYHLHTFLVYAALEEQELCSLPALYDFVSLPPEQIFTHILDNSRSSYVRNRIVQMGEELRTGADKQLFWKLEKLAAALEPYERHTELGVALRRASFDPSVLKRKPSTLYFQLPESTLSGYADYIACAITSLVNQLADTEGPQKIWYFIDEASQLPRMNLPAWIRLLRKTGAQFCTVWQSVSSIEEVYGRAGCADLLSNSDIILNFSIDDVARARHLSERAGTKTILGRSMNRGGDQRSSTDSLSEQRISELPVADILNLPRDEQLIEMTGLKLLRARRFPWWEIEPFSNRLHKFSDLPSAARYARDIEDFDDDWMENDQ